MSSWVDASVALLAGHPHWAGLFVFLVAALEAVVLAGYVIPGAMILVAVGGIVGVGHLPLLPILAWATAGAIAGDGFSFWLGYRYRETLTGRWPFSRYPDLMAQGEAFFRRHGGKSVVLGRFLPVLRPIIPTVAGILGMPPRRFYPANALSALVWAPLHILPGVLAGASLELLRGVSPRLAVAALGVLAVLVLSWWSTRLLVLRTTPLARRLFDRAYAWTQRNRGSLLQRLAVRFDPAHPATAALVATLTLLVVALAGFFALLEDVVTRDELVRSDQAISTLMQGLRNPWTDPFMIAVSSLGDSIVTGAVALTLLGWLVLRGHRRLALAAGSALALTAAGLPLLKLLVRAPRPVAMYAGFDAFSFPSGHTSMAAAVYGLVAWLGAGALGQRWRPLVYLPALFWMLLMATSRVYLGAHWSSDVLAGLCFGLLAPLALAALYHAYPRTGVHPGRMVVLLTLVLATFGASHLSRTWGQSVARYLPEETVKPLERRRLVARPRAEPAEPAHGPRRRARRAARPPVAGNAPSPGLPARPRRLGGRDTLARRRPGRVPATRYRDRGPADPAQAARGALGAAHAHPRVGHRAGQPLGAARLALGLSGCGGWGAVAAGVPDARAGAAPGPDAHPGVARAVERGRHPTAAGLRAALCRRSGRRRGREGR